MTSLEPALLLEALSFIVDFHKDATVLEFLQVRRILEPAATAMAAKRITEDEITGLGKLLDSLGKHPEVEDLVANDLEFHRRIAACSGNTVLCSLLETLSAPTTRARVWRGLTQAGARERTLDEHRAILDALASRRSGGGEVVGHGAHRQRRTMARIRALIYRPLRDARPPSSRYTATAFAPNTASSSAGPSRPASASLASATTSA